MNTTNKFSFRTKLFFIMALAIIAGALVSRLNPPLQAKKIPAWKSNSKSSAIQLLPNIPVVRDNMIPLISPLTTSPVVKKPVPKPEVSADSYIVGNLVTGKIYFSLAPDKAMPIASVSKLMTAFIASEIVPTSTPIKITEKMLEPEGTTGNLRVGETYSFNEIMYPMLLESSNDAAQAIAISTGYDKFISPMDAVAQEIGMTKTIFSDPSGLSEGNISTARDLFSFARYLYTHDSGILAITRLAHFDLATSTEHDGHSYTNTNPFVGDPRFIGGKTGRTDAARETMLSLFNSTVENPETHASTTYPIAVIILHSDFGVREQDTTFLLNKFIKSAKNF